MIKEEYEYKDEQLHITNEADTEELSKRELWEHPEVLELVLEQKKRKCTRSGLLVVIIGVILIASSLLLKTGAHSIEGFIAGVGVIVIIAGILRILIGLIRPVGPSQM